MLDDLESDQDRLIEILGALLMEQHLLVLLTDL